ncbi:hypothetical protein BZZ01_03735 [Nostocales cyanobacterium HT-58-2]|nr:hypothetical protein BZZ01_03735 [Nostocales cyanobacterium HT-58-2]
MDKNQKKKKPYFKTRITHIKSSLYEILLSVLGASALIVQPQITNAANSAPPLSCSDTYLPVALAPGESSQYQVYGQLCSRYPLSNRTVQVLVPGGTYDHNYWDLSYQPEQYSYVDALTQAGYATFNIDRIGIGNSSRPPADQVTVQSNGYVLNQVNQLLRSGKINGVQFDNIINVGHSLGSIIAIETAIQYGGVDGVILSGLIHNLRSDSAQALRDSLYPAQLDPRLSEENVPEGYRTTLPGTRGQLFYNQSNTDPQVIALDEATKQTQTTGEAAALRGGVAALPDTRQINVPVLLAIGQKDNLSCIDNICNPENVPAFEAPFFSPQAQLQTYVLPDAGHVMNLELNASLWYYAARQWSDRFVGTISVSVPEPASVVGLLMLTAGGSLLVLQKLVDEKR